MTDERMTRFFMSIEEAVQLVLQAAALAESDRGGEVFMLDMGEPVSILHLAERMIRLSGRQPGTDIEIEITGIRPGEKLAEELTSLEESEEPTSHSSVRRVTPVAIDPELLELQVVHLDDLARDGAGERCGAHLRQLAGHREPPLEERPMFVTR